MSSKGSAVEIAEAYRRKRLETERMLHSEGKVKARRLAKMLNSSSSTTSRDHNSKLSPLPVSILYQNQV